MRPIEIPAKRLSLTAMFSAFSVIFIYLSAVVPTANISLFFVSSLFVSGMIVEDQPFAAFMVYIVSSLLSLLLVPNIIMVLPYVLLFGHYGIGKYLIERIKDRFVSFVFKLLYFNAGLVAIYFLYGAFFAPLLERLPLYALLIIAQAVFFAYDFCYSKLIIMYEVRIRNKLIR